MKISSVTVFGGSGFLGRYIVRRLARRGLRVRVATRHPNRAMFLKPCGDVGQIQLMYADIKKRGDIERALHGVDAAINLVGILAQSGRQKFSTLQAEAPGVIGTMAKKSKLRALVHVSAIGADEDSPSRYARSKAKGEAAIRKAFGKVTILRPSIVVGPEDDFFNRFAAIAKIFPVLPVVGADTKFQPVYVADVADATVRALLEDGYQSRIYELGGPGIYTFRELMRLMMDEIGIKRPIVNLPAGLAKFQAFFLQALPNPPLTVDQVKMLSRDNVVAKGARTFADLGLTPRPVESVIPDYLARFRPKGQFSGRGTRSS